MKDKYMILGVSFDWGKRKGIDVFVELSKRLDPERFQIVLVGVEKDTVTLPDSIIVIDKTSDQKALAEIYSAADVFVNPTREDNYPTVNMEAISCGTPVITFRTGGSPEMIDGNVGSVVEVDDIDGLQKEIEEVCFFKPFSEDEMVKISRSFDKWERYKDYLDVYEVLLKQTQK